MKVAMVSIYPPLGSRTSKRGGMGRYAKDLISALPGDCEVLVLADRIGSSGEYAEGKVKVARCWTPGPLYPFQLVRRLWREKVDVVHIQHEVFFFGSVASGAALPLLLVLLRAMGLKVVITAHNGIVPRGDLDRDFLEDNGIKGGSRLLMGGLRLIMSSIDRFSDAVIVHEDRMGRTLVEEYGFDPCKISVVHHGIEEGKEPLPGDLAKERLGVPGKRTILFLGYIAGYKGLDVLVESAKFITTSDWIMLIGGGTHPRLKNDQMYLEYVARLKRKAAETGGGKVLFKGFVPEEDLRLYLSAADLLVFPYRTFMAASGPMAIAMSYGKPFLASKAFTGVVDDDMLFSDGPEALARKIDDLFSGTLCIDQVKYGAMRAERSWSSVAARTRSIYASLLENGE